MNNLVQCVGILVYSDGDEAIVYKLAKGRLAYIPALTFDPHKGFREDFPALAPFKKD